MISDVIQALIIASGVIGAIYFLHEGLRFGVQMGIVG